MYTIKNFGLRLDGKNGITGEISGLTIDNVLSHIRNLKVNCSLSVYKDGKHVGGAFVNYRGEKTVSFLKTT
jgi:hypothetical protein